MMVSSSMARIGDQIMLLSPLGKFVGNYKLQFYYYMHLDDSDKTAALSLYRYSQLQASDQQLFVATGDQGTSWQLATVCLPSGTYRLAFVATIGIPYLSDMAIDDISYDTTSCIPAAAEQTINGNHS